ncbi:calcium dependent protein kinase 28 [Selaginella moellendorffii]|uniref:non-specific serine/threonine protein kinase n=1 Tax=Selaginella moellendorffii TaxID=88036 RepID=D8SDC0_SELML|nr:calcium-dependent protein kinase 16 isoform X2 [Selaginella moellendorffii]EFJ17487.1 calcium dependent protein kinase 28 [Selaginella moellendorffii]|eukprot:XP_002981299.1 calcium-dependent protein kinase 16 isoform X2 [Selaginella moellendorffii]
MGVCFSVPKRRKQDPATGNAKSRVRPAGHNRKNNAIPLGLRTNFGYGRDFKSKYRIGKLLGHGQFGYTYSAVELMTGDKVAVKRIEKKKMLLPISIEDVKREVKILDALSGHENVVQFHAAFEDDEFVYIVMELCEGGELLDRILAKKEGRYTEKDAAVIVRQMLRVVARCHLNGVVHRDLKPENFLFKSQQDDSLLRAVDFGLSDFIRPGKRFHDVVGSAYYVAPEVLKRKSGPESDVWSVGVITYILLCGRRPFWDKTEAGIFNEVLKRKPDLRERPWPSIGSSAKDFVRKLLVKDPRARLTAAQALSHPWVREGGDALEIPLDISVLSNMREFVKYSRLKQLAFRALATTLDPEDIAALRDQFDAIDADKSGSISLEEMKQALAKDRPWDLKESMVMEILQAMDCNCDGLVDFEEFVAATLHVHQLEDMGSDKWQKRSKAAFDQLDVDGDGYITSEELKQYTGLKGSLGTLLEEGDIDGDGRISLAEFQKLLRQASLGSRN